MKSRSSARPAPDANSIDSEPEPFRILLIEDNPGDVAIVRYVLSENVVAHEITVVGDGDTAIDLLRRIDNSLEPPPDLILLDINLPKRSGFEVLTYVRANPMLGSTVVNMLTSSLNQVDVDTAYRLGANAYTLKQSNLDRTFDVLSGMFRYWYAFCGMGPVETHA